MFEYEKKKIKDIEEQLDGLKAELISKTEIQNDLEKNADVRVYMELLKNPKVCEYIAVSNKRKELRNSISESEKNLSAIRQDICLHHTLLFLEDLTDEYDRNMGTSVYKCLCLDCGLVVKLQFVNGKRNNTSLINIGMVDFDRLGEISEVYNWLKDSGLYEKDIVKELARGYGDSHVKKKIKSFFSIDSNY